MQLPSPVVRRTRVTPLARWALAAGALAVASVVPAAAPAGATSSSPSSATGNDVSYPQCSSNLPTGAAFGVVGVDDGIANKVNPCLTAEIAWASGTSGNAASSFGGSQPRAQLYVNTADPGDVYNGQPIADWPSNNAGGGANPYGTCTTTVVKTSRHKTTTVGQNSTACAWQYGWNAATNDVKAFFSSAASSDTALDPHAGDYPWWLDVETGNTWQSSSGGGLAMNDAVLEGMVTYLSTLTATGGAPATVGIYSTGYQWNQITGGEGAVDGNWSTNTHSSAPAPLDGRPDWVPGAVSASGADSICQANAPFTGTAPNTNVTLAQWTSAGVDGDVSC